MRLSRSSGAGTFALAGWLFADLLLGAMMLFFADWRVTPPPISLNPPLGQQEGDLTVPTPEPSPTPSPTSTPMPTPNVNCASSIERDPILVKATGLSDNQLRSSFAPDSPAAVQARDTIRDLFSSILNARYPEGNEPRPRVGMVVTFANTGRSFTPDSNALGTSLANGIIRAIQDSDYLKGAVFQEGYLDNRLFPGEANLQFYMLVCQQP